jgi:DNA-binding response OmpR family regulator
MNHKHHILIVDDEPAILFAFSQFLKSPTIVIETASTLEDAVDVLKLRQFDAVVADLRLTGTANIEGYEVVRSVKLFQDACTIIVVTAYGGDGIKNTVFQLGADFYFEKPVSPQKIKDTLKQRGIY